MRALVTGMVLLAGVALVNIAGAIAFLVAGQFVLHLDPTTNASHITEFMVTIVGMVVAVASAFPIFGRGVPWLTLILERAWLERAPEHSSSQAVSYSEPAAAGVHIEHQQIGGVVEPDVPLSEPAGERVPLADPHVLDRTQPR